MVRLVTFFGWAVALTLLPLGFYLGGVSPVIALPLLGAYAAGVLALAAPWERLAALLRTWLGRDAPESAVLERARVRSYAARRESRLPARRAAALGCVATAAAV